MGKKLYENEKLEKIKNKEKKSYLKKFESQWKRKIDVIEISSDDEHDDDSWNGIFQTDINKQSRTRSHKEMPSRIIKDMNKMTAQKEIVLDQMSKVEKLHLDQDLFLKWETVETVECKKITKTVEETAEYKKIMMTVEVRLDKIKTKIYRKYDEQ